MTPEDRIIIPDPRDAEIARLKHIQTLQRHTISRWVPCPGHRDKTTQGICYVCENERLRSVIAKLCDNPTNPGALARARHEIADGRAFT